MIGRKLIAWAGHRGREAGIYLRRLGSRRRAKEIVFFPFGDRENVSSRDRVYVLGEELRRLGWGVTVVPKQLELGQRRRVLRLVKPDILFIQKDYHPLNWPDLYEAKHKVFDLDDADFVDPKLHDQVVACCKRTELVICGNRYVADFCRKYNPNTHVVWNGAEARRRPTSPPSTRRPVVAWGSGDSNAYSYEREFLGDVMTLVTRATEVEFRVYGVRDRGALEPFVLRMKQNQVNLKLFPLQPFEQHLLSVQEAAVGVHPVGNNPFNLGKSFGKLSAYMMCDVPVVVHRKNDFPEFYEDGVNGMLAGDDVAEWAEKIVRILRDPPLRDRLANKAWESYAERLNGRVAAGKVDRLLNSLLSETRSPEVVSI